MVKDTERADCFEDIFLAAGDHRTLQSVVKLSQAFVTWSWLLTKPENLEAATVSGQEIMLKCLLFSYQALCYDFSQYFRTGQADWA